MCPYVYIVLSSYALCAFIGGFLSMILLYFRLDKYNIEFTTFLKSLIVSLIGGLVGSKLLYSITRIPWLIKNFSLLNLLLLFPQSGLVFYGGLFGVLFSLRIYTRRNTSLRERILFMVTPAIPFFHMFGRIGCFLAGCCYGKEMGTVISLFGFVKFDRIPVQLIEAVFELFLFIILLLKLPKSEKNTDGVKIYLLSYAAFRFVIEFFRGDEVRGVYLGFSTSQWISILIYVYYLSGFIRSKIKNHKICI